MNTEAAAELPARLALCSKLILGVNRPMSATLVTCRASSACSEKAVIETGVSCRFSDRLRAVTTTSSRPVTPSGAGADCAHAAGAIAAPHSRLATRSALALFE